MDLCAGVKKIVVATDHCEKSGKSKILKKFEVLNVAFLRDELIKLDSQLTKLFGKGEFKLSKNKIKLLIKMNS